ncbi:MAG: winged helix-turn-helix domain-containing protein [Alistipes sp.]|nr:winged helix-turn-helix domain-containing protein [Alistipes sp.]MBR6631105.1 winged helix-turn-helix domain-containing protein [Alistipes sp.]
MCHTAKPVFRYNAEPSKLLKELWGDDNYFKLRSLNLYITRLSNHLKPDPTVEIESVRGIGYLLK